MKRDVPDAIFPSTEFGIPLLREDLPADFVDAPVRGWGSVTRLSRMRGTWHFYVDDIKFKTLWEDPSKVLVSQAVSAVEVNYTINDQMPFAVAIYRIYQKRWISRYLQERGMRIFVDLNVPAEYEQTNLLGVPTGWPSYATAATDSRLEDLERQYNLAAINSGLSQGLKFLVYGGGKKVKAFCESHDCVHIGDARNEARTQPATTD